MARELVGLAPEDCFALATYKIHLALQKQDQEHLPYIFLVVGVPGLTGDAVGGALPEDVVHLCAIVKQTKLAPLRSVEDRAVEWLAATGENVEDLYQRIRQAAWYALSARRAFQLMQEKLFNRIFALRVRGFARSYRNAELDMHFSLSEDLTPLDTFLTVLRQDGIQGLASRLERGTF